MMSAAALAARSPAASSRVPCETTASHVSHPKRLVRRLQASTSTSASTSTTSATPQQLTDTHETLNFPIERVISDWQTGYVSLHGERSDVKLDVTRGAIPNSLKGGVLIRNGPGALERGGAKLNQPFDGDGMLVRLAFDTEGDSVNFSNAYVKTQGYVDEVAANKFIYKSAFSTGNPAGDWFYNPFDFSTKNVANTHVALLGGRLLALWEGGLPHVVDPKRRAGGLTEVLMRRSQLTTNAQPHHQAKREGGSSILAPRRDQVRQSSPSTNSKTPPTRTDAALASVSSKCPVLDLDSF